jgi:hypothetical protein
VAYRPRRQRVSLRVPHITVATLSFGIVYECAGQEDLSEKMPSPAKLFCRNFEVAEMLRTRISL